MIDIISSSIRIGNFLKEDDCYKAIAAFYCELDKNNPVAHEYFNYLNRYLLEYGFMAFEAVDFLLKNNANNSEAFVRATVKKISALLSTIPDYNKILKLSRELEEKADKYVFDILTHIKGFPNPPVSKPTPKIQQISNELSTAVIRSGVCSWINNPKQALFVSQSKDFLDQYERATAKFRKGFPYNKSIRNIIESYDKSNKLLAKVAENQKLVQFLIKNGIVQGFFYKIIELHETEIVKLRESYKSQPIHPVAIRINGLLSLDRALFFRYRTNNETNYLICRKMNIKYTPDQCITNLFGYRYPTNEYSIFTLPI